MAVREHPGKHTSSYPVIARRERSVIVGRKVDYYAFNSKKAQQPRSVVVLAKNHYFDIFVLPANFCEYLSHCHRLASLIHAVPACHA